MLAGHFISCVYSGHTGKFFMLAYLCLALWLLTAGIRKRSILYLLWSGVCGGLGVSSQLDVGFIVIIFFAAWLIFLIDHLIFVTQKDAVHTATFDEIEYKLIDYLTDKKKRDIAEEWTVDLRTKADVKYK